MIQNAQSLAVMDIAEICGVARSTVSYWISKKGLSAFRSGNKFMVNANDLVFYLKSEGHPVPDNLFKLSGGPYPLPFKPFKPCWEHWARDVGSKKCKNCKVFLRKIEECFVTREDQNGQGRKPCHECPYYLEYYAPGVAFIHQLDKPGAVCKDLYLLAGNEAWADLCGVSTEDLIGSGIEEFLHPDSLKVVINNHKRRERGDATAPSRYRAFFVDRGVMKIETHMSVHTLRRPVNAWLALVDRID